MRRTLFAVPAVLEPSPPLGMITPTQPAGILHSLHLTEKEFSDETNCEISGRVGSLSSLHTDCEQVCAGL